mgnify:CR=1 FL=1
MKAETLRALKNARDLAMKNTLAASAWTCPASRIPECGDFGHIAQDLDYVLNDIEAYTAPPRVVDVDLLKMLVRIRDDKTWRTNDNSLWPDLLALIRKHESALEKP